MKHPPPAPEVDATARKTQLEARCARLSAENEAMKREQTREVGRRQPGRTRRENLRT